MAVDYKVSLISTTPAVYAVVAIERDGSERIIGRYQTLHRAELRVKRLHAMMAAEVEYTRLQAQPDDLT
jgi:hypothetical protein